MKSFIIAAMLALTTSFGIAASEVDSDRFNYSGVRGNHQMNLSTETTKIEYRWVQVPYQEQECRNETRYRQVCRTVPGRRVCHTEPGRQVCRVRQICRTAPGGQRRCHNQRVCRMQPGRRVCRTTPPTRQCRQEPYNQRICRTVTRYRQERRAYTVVDHRTNATVLFSFINATVGGVTDFSINANLNRSQLTFRAEDNSSPRRVAVEVRRLSHDNRGSQTVINDNHAVTLHTASEFFSALTTPLVAAEVTGGNLAVTTGKLTALKNESLTLRIAVNGAIRFDRELNPGEYQTVVFNSQEQIILPIARLANLSTGEVADITFRISTDRTKVLNHAQFIDWEESATFRRVVR